jgi:hypothetical protein
MKYHKVIIILLLSFSITVYAVNSTQIKLGNIGGTAIMTLVRGILQGKVHNLKDIGKMLLYGGISGYGFYQSKNLISKGKVLPGVVLANLSVSVVENVSNRNHLLSHIGYSLGFARINISTPFNKNKGSIINVDISPKEIIALFVAIKYSNKIVFKDGVISFKAKEKFGNAIGWCAGAFPTVVENIKEYVYKHEVIHMVQNLQLISVSYEPFFKKKKHHSLFDFHIRTQSLNVVFGILNTKDYDKNIKEIETHYFVKDRG